MIAQPCFNYRIVLAENVYFVEFRYNGRFDFWTIDIAGNDGTPILSGRKLVSGHTVGEDLALDVPDLLPLNLLDPLGRITLQSLGNDASVYAV